MKKVTSLYQSVCCPCGAPLDRFALVARLGRVHYAEIIGLLFPPSNRLLPEELILAIGEFVCASPFSTTEEAERYRLRSLYTLALVSKQFNRIFAHVLYKRPRFHGARSLNNLNVSKLRCLREITFSGNFAYYIKWNWNGTRIRNHLTLRHEDVPNLVLVRFVNVDDVGLIAVFLGGIGPTIKSAVIHPSASGRDEHYSPLSVYSNLQYTIQRLVALESFKISLPALKTRCRSYRAARRLFEQELVTLPRKDCLKSLSVSLMSGGKRGAEHDYQLFGVAFRTFLSQCTSLEQLDFTGTSTLEFKKQLRALLPGRRISFKTPERMANESPARSMPFQTNQANVPVPINCEQSSTFSSDDVLTVPYDLPPCAMPATWHHLYPCRRQSLFFPTNQAIPSLLEYHLLHPPSLVPSNWRRETAQQQQYPTSGPVIDDKFCDEGSSEAMQID